MSFNVGYAQSVITPDLARPVFLAGFGRNRQADTVHDNLYARTLAIRGAGRLIIVVAVDLISLDRHFCRRISRDVQAALPAAQLLIAATHTHHGPDTLGLWGPDELTSGVDPVYMEQLHRMVVDTAVRAAAAPQPAHLAAAGVLVRGVAKNFRDPHIADEELTCLQFRDPAAGRPLATWLVYPCHPEVLWDQNTRITSDYMDTLRRTVEAQSGAPCLAHVGALGGMMSPDVTDHSFAEAAEMGETLAAAALEALKTTVAHPLTRLQFDKQLFAVPLQNPIFEMASAAGLLPDIREADGTVCTSAGLLRLNDCWLFAVPGELLPKLGLQYRAALAAAGARVTGIIGLANDELGYILPAEDFHPPQDYLNPGSSYEESMSVGPETGPRLTAALQALLNE